MGIHCRTEHGRDLKAAPSMTFDILSRVAELPDEEWDRLTGDEHAFLTRPYLTSLERAGVPMRHVVFRRDGRAVGGASFHSTTFGGAPLNSVVKIDCPLFSMITRPIKAFRTPFSYRLLVCGSPFASGPHGYVFEDAITDSLKGAALRAAARAAVSDIAPDDAVSGVLFKEFGDGAAPLVDALSERRFVKIDTEPAMVLRVSPRWRCFEDYLAVLSSKYRVKAKRAYTKSAALVVRSLDVDQIAAFGPQLTQLLAAVVGRARFKLGSPDIESLGAMRAAMGDAFIVKGYFLDGEPVGFLTGFVNGDTLEAGLVGIDYACNPTHGVYPRMLCDYVRIAIERRLSAVNFGRTAGEIKSTLGAEPVAMHCAVHLNNPTLNALLGAVKRNIRPTAETYRQPFRKAWYTAEAGKATEKYPALSVPVETAGMRRAI